ncbi:ubiquinone biosynthesis protein UbiH, partial [Paracidovorax avenae]
GSAPASGKAPARSWALAGDAAHTVHPLAGQGLNLGLADAQALARVLRERDYWRGVADQRLLRRYERERKAALLPMGWAMDSLQQLFSRHEGPVPWLRNWGMRGFERSGPLKDWVTRQAMGLG